MVPVEVNEVRNDIPVILIYQQLNINLLMNHVLQLLQLKYQTTLMVFAFSHQSNL